MDSLCSLQETGQESSSADFIDIFLDAEIDDGGDGVEVDQYLLFIINYWLSLKGSRRLVFDEIVSQCMVMLLAGFEVRDYCNRRWFIDWFQTTSNSLSYLTHFLANHSDVQEKMREEIDRECPGDVRGKRRNIERSKINNYRVLSMIHWSISSIQKLL